MGWTARGGPGAGSAGWDGAGWFPPLQLSHGSTSKGHRLLSDGATGAKMSLKRTSVLTRSVLRFGYRRRPFGLKTEDAHQYRPPRDSECVFVSVSNKDSTITKFQHSYNH